ncbi:MAG: chloride channel protein [Bacteroidales bacterium]|jgi:CIC family chloride channel protein|nr:chloride channel protein [Bacteroidales bacterium]
MGRVKYLQKRWLIFAKRIKKRLGIPGTVLWLSLFTGIFGGTIAIILKNLLHFTTSMLGHAFPYAQVNYLYLAFPLAGIVLTSLYVSRVVNDNLSHGVSIALKSMCVKGGRLKRHNMYSSMIASSITVGFGGSVGLEAPIVLTGSAVGSNLARFFDLTPKYTRLLLACGATAALAAIFKAPVAGMVFAVEVLMLDLTATAVLPLLVSAATGTVLSLLFLGEDVMFRVTTTASFELTNIPFYVIAGALAGLLSVYFLRVSRWVENLCRRVNRLWVKSLTGGVLLGGLILIFPVFYGEGYESIKSLIENNPVSLFSQSPLFGLLEAHRWLLPILLAAVILLKVIAATLTTGSGGVGGLFAPSLFVGAFFGFTIAYLVNTYGGGHLPVANFTLAGMAGVMTGVMHAPLTGIFLIAELSSGYTLLIPLMITASLSYLTVRRFEAYSVYTKPLADKGMLLTHNKDKFALQRINWKSMIDKDISTISITATLREYTKIIAVSKRNLFVVLDKENLFAGLLVMDEHREILFRPELYDLVRVKDLMIEPSVFVYNTDSGEDIIRKFRETNNFNMPVITHARRYIGFISKAKMLSAYKDFIASESED